MALCNLKTFLVKLLLVLVIVTNLHQLKVSASPSPLFFDAIANFFKPNRQPSGSSSSYGAPKPISYRPVAVTITPNYNYLNYNYPKFTIMCVSLSLGWLGSTAGVRRAAPPAGPGMFGKVGRRAGR